MQSPFELAQQRINTPMQQNRLKFQTRTTNYQQFLIDLGEFNGSEQQLQLYPAPRPSFSLSVNERYTYQNHTIVTDKKLIRQFSAAIFAHSSTVFTPLIRLQVPTFESGQASFLCGERREDCRCAHSVVQGREVLGYQRKCRAGGHHVAPFGHGFV